MIPDTGVGGLVELSIGMSLDSRAGVEAPFVAPPSLPAASSSSMGSRYVGPGMMLEGTGTVFPRAMAGVTAKGT